MSPLVLALSALSLLTLLALVLAVTALCQIRSVARALEKRGRDQEAERSAAVQTLRSELDALASQVREGTPEAAISPPPRIGLNLAKRSQALRLNRHGNSPTQIASNLDVPLQEVELLLKVDRIVLSNL